MDEEFENLTGGDLKYFLEEINKGLYIDAFHRQGLMYVNDLTTENINAITKDESIFESMVIIEHFLRKTIKKLGGNSNGDLYTNGGVLYKILDILIEMFLPDEPEELRRLKGNLEAFLGTLNGIMSSSTEEDKRPLRRMALNHAMDFFTKTDTGFKLISNGSTIEEYESKKQQLQEAAPTGDLVVPDYGTQSPHETSDRFSLNEIRDSINRNIGSLKETASRKWNTTAILRDIEGNADSGLYIDPPTHLWPDKKLYTPSNGSFGNLCGKSPKECKRLYKQALNDYKVAYENWEVGGLKEGKQLRGPGRKSLLNRGKKFIVDNVRAVGKAVPSPKKYINDLIDRAQENSIMGGFGGGSKRKKPKRTKKLKKPKKHKSPKKLNKPNKSKKYKKSKRAKI